MVAWDFSEQAQFALDHASSIAKITGSMIYLVHIVKRDNQLEEFSNKLDIFISDYKTDLRIQKLVQKGSIFNSINELSKDKNALMVFMGTHGIKGMQKIMGSSALKVIEGSLIPFIVVQSPPNKERYKSIVLPVDYKSDSRESLYWLIYLNSISPFEIKLFKANYENDCLESRKLKTNIKFISSYLSERNIKFSISSANKGENYVKATIRFAEETDSDMIAVVTTKNISIADYMLGAEEQYLIANKANIAVMCINPRTDLAKYGSFY
jgi:nucleotide-binding universal stress UspA family protein